jgi:diguanylate cyclase (GGDEF)-like protein
MIRVYSDFNCPFCFVQHTRIKQLGLENDVEWRFVEHAPNLSSQVESEQAITALNSEYSLILQRGSDTEVNNPQFCVNTRIAILSFISIRQSHPQIAFEYLSEIYKAYWQQAKDISDTIVLRGILSHFAINELKIDSNAEIVQNRWQQQWQSGGFDSRIPALSTSGNRLLLGLQHIKNISNFISHSPEVKYELGTVCSFQEKGHLAVLNGENKISKEILSPEIFKLSFFNSLNEFSQFTLNESPDIIIVDFELDKSKNFQTVELLKKTLDSELNDIPVIYYFNQAAQMNEKAMAFTLGAIDSFSYDEDVALINARLKRRTIDSRKLRQLNNASSIDSLTGVYNRREFEVAYEKLWRISSRKQLPLSVVMVDIDFFKQYNDQYGHLQGDECLIKVANIIKSSAKRSADIVARFGGEEFIIVLFDIKASQAENVAEKMRKAIETERVQHNSRELPHDITASFGVCSLHPHADISPNKAIEIADRAMYEAKSLGRNQVCHEKIKPIIY